METLRIKRKDLYEIEVNDKGEKLVFDLNDVDLPFKLQRAFDGIRKTQKYLEGQLVVISKMEDGVKDKDHLMTRKQEAENKAVKKAFNEMRAAMDEFLGEGGCQKVFGDSNYYSMFDDLMDALMEKGEDGTSHLDRMKITARGVEERLKAKYSTDNGEFL